MAKDVGIPSDDALLFHPDEIREIEPCSIGAALKRARLARMLSIDALAELTRISAPYIEALEAGQLERFTAPIYAVGFARSYARELGLDPEWAEREMRRHIADSAPQWRRSGWVN